ncbi:MAG TPA: hypothetical protein VK709_20355 [Candidatus Saccharimonadales bacterium]|nr:hypothetical protein [Candidatus Saccharimonadales bacterium]
MLLTSFCSATYQDYKVVANFTKVNPVAWAEINAVLMNASPNALGAGIIPLSDACQGSRYLGRRLCVQTVRSRGKRTVSALVKILAYFDYA